jgi:N-sulfoglucosamine sulfohydrolase
MISPLPIPVLQAVLSSKHLLLTGLPKKGIYFNNCFAGSPGCAPSRSTIVTGRYHWQNEQAGQHASSWLKKYVPFIDLLDGNGYPPVEPAKESPLSSMPGMKMIRSGGKPTQVGITHSDISI